MSLTRNKKAAITLTILVSPLQFRFFASVRHARSLRHNGTAGPNPSSRNTITKPNGDTRTSSSRFFERTAIPFSGKKSNLAEFWRFTAFNRGSILPRMAAGTTASLSCSKMAPLRTTVSILRESSSNSTWTRRPTKKKNREDLRFSKRTGFYRSRMSTWLRSRLQPC
jgi:hypothetical protein